MNDDPRSAPAVAVPPMEQRGWLTAAPSGAAASRPAGVVESPRPVPSPLTRRGFLRTAAIAGGGLVVAGVASCTTAAGPGWTFGAGQGHDHGTAPASPAAPIAGGPTPAPTDAHNHNPGTTPAASGVAAASPGASIPAGWALHDVQAKAAVDRYLAGEYKTVPGAGNQPLAARLDGDTHVFDMTIDAMKHQIDGLADPIDALGYNGTWPGPILRVTEGDRIRAIFKNNLPETTAVHFHGQALPNAMDGVAMITQDPIVPGASFTYEFVARPSGSHMYHSHHNATDQVGRGLLGAFIVDPKDPAERYPAKYGTTQDIVWISNDQLGGFTINGRGFPATTPIVAKLGEKILIRFMNEGVMMHPWHVHGVHFRVVARDGWPLGGAEFRCDTLGVNPGERYDVVIDCDNPGVWAFHCHILPHAEAMQGMFGMVTALIVQA